MIGKKRWLYKCIELMAIAGVLLLIQGLAVTGAFYYTDNYDRCAKRDAQFVEGQEQAVAKAEFYNFKVLVLSGGEGKAMVAMPSTAHTDQVARELHRMYVAAGRMLYTGIFLCSIAYLLLRKKRHYRVLKQGVFVSLAAPVFTGVFLLCTHFAQVKNWLACVLFSQYQVVFYDDEAFVSVLPKGLFRGYAFSYCWIWIVASLALFIVYSLKRKHRRPYSF